ncbi:acetoacetate decarboxylase family protein [Paraburkholderia sp. J67]|uniref:acetoacetate decarboxylase family protein n=1 Tax=Paraburkholderia sp. J67 TaxID=2805435 RepID=UPI002ABE2D44|nr:acetoacetate decarboxylase family protein [Paraburkholderia sp. J67]
MSCEIKQGVRYRMPVPFGPAPGPRQHPEGRMWTKEETGRMEAEWMKVSYLTDEARLANLLPPGFSLRGAPIVSVSCAWFDKLYWLAGRGYGILSIDFPVTYRGKTETLEGTFCPVIWEGAPDAIMTGREELGFPKMFANIPRISRDSEGNASSHASWLDFRFCDVALSGLVEEANPAKNLPGSGGGAQLYFKYMPRTSPGGREGADVAYVTTAAPPAGSGGSSDNIKFADFEFRRWTGKGTVAWHAATFQQLPLAAHVVNVLADLEVIEYIDAELVAFSGPGIGISVDAMRRVEPA